MRQVWKKLTRQNWQDQFTRTKNANYVNWDFLKRIMKRNTYKLIGNKPSYIAAVLNSQLYYTLIQLVIIQRQ